LAQTSVPIVYVEVDFDGTSINNYPFFVTPNEGNFYPADLVFTLQEVSGLISPPSVSVGTNPDNYNNIVSSTTLTGLVSPEETYRVVLNTVVTSIPVNTQLYVRVGVAAVATTFKFRAHFSGHHYS